MPRRRSEKQREASVRAWRKQWEELLKEVPPRPETPRGMPALRRTVVTPRKLSVDTSVPIWRVHRGNADGRMVGVNVDLLYRPYAGGVSTGSGKLAGIPRRDSVFSPEVVHAMVLFVARLTEKRVGFTPMTAVYELARFEQFLAGEGVEAGEITPAFLTKELYEPSARQDPYSHGHFQHFYKWCVVQGFQGYHAREFIRIDSVVYSQRPPRGANIRSSDEHKGALTWDEKQVLVRALKDPAPDTEVWDRALAWLLLELGCRVSAIAAMRNKHLQPTPLRDSYVVRVPRVKQRRPVKDTVPRKISKPLGDLLMSIRQGGDEDSLLPPEFSGEKNWCPRSLRRFVLANDIRTPRITERGGDGAEGFSLLPLTSYRLRYTMATTLAEEGASPEQIAAMLDDRTLAMAMVYTANTSQLVDILEETLDRHPAWLRHMRLFLGRVSTEQDAKMLPRVQGGVPYFTNYEKYAEKIGPIGWCGNPRACEDRPPLGCYRCAWFLSDPDPGVHVQQLEQLKDEVKGQVGVESDRMAKVLRPDMFAVAEVIVLTRGGQTNSQRVQTKIAREGA